MKTGRRVLEKFTILAEEKGENYTELRVAGISELGYHLSMLNEILPVYMKNPVNIAVASDLTLTVARIIEAAEERGEQLKSKDVSENP